MKRGRLFGRYAFIALSLIGAISLSCGGSRKFADTRTPEEPYDVLLEVTPISVKAVNRDSIIDVLETDDAEKMTDLNTIVLFRIEKVIKGDFTTMKMGGPSKMEQAKSAVTKGKVLKLVTLDFKDPDEIIEKKWVNVAVENAWRSFEITDWENPHRRRVRLYLKRIPEQPSSYILIQSSITPE